MTFSIGQEKERERLNANFLLSFYTAAAAAVTQSLSSPHIPSQLKARKENQFATDTDLKAGGSASAAFAFTGKAKLRANRLLCVCSMWRTEVC